jgi:hypothetical protein
MKRLLLLSALSVGLMGCDTTKGFFAPSAPEKVAKSADSRSPMRAPVVADQVNTENAKDKAKALSDEMDRDLQSAIEARDKDK